MDLVKLGLKERGCFIVEKANVNIAQKIKLLSSTKRILLISVLHLICAERMTVITKRRRRALLRLTKRISMISMISVLLVIFVTRKDAIISPCFQEILRITNLTFMILT